MATKPGVVADNHNANQATRSELLQIKIVKI